MAVTNVDNQDLKLKNNIELYFEKAMVTRKKRNICYTIRCYGGYARQVEFIYNFFGSTAILVERDPGHHERTRWHF